MILYKDVAGKCRRSQAAQLAHRAGLNCGKGDSCRRSNECEEFTLHRFRRTDITKMLTGLNGGLRTVQQLAGHKDVEATTLDLKAHTVIHHLASRKAAKLARRQ